MSAFDDLAKVYVERKFGRSDVQSVYFGIDSVMDGCCGECLSPVIDIEVSVRFIDGSFEEFSGGSSLDDFLQDFCDRTSS